MGTRGIVYIAIGQEALQMALDSAKSVSDHSSELQSITILCDRDYYHPDSEISLIDITNYFKINCKNQSCLVAYLKTCLHELSPYDKTLYLDNDIRAVQSIDSIWDYVEKGIGLCKAFNPLVKGVSYRDNSEESYTANLITNWNQYNSGMFLFMRSPAMSNFFKKWTTEWHRFEIHENMALNRLIESGQIKTIRLPCKFNDFYPNRNSESVLIHYISHFKRYLELDL